MLNSSLPVMAAVLVSVIVLFISIIRPLYRTWLKVAPSRVLWAWWVEISTEQPSCTYYFGPFASATEADAAKFDYVQDLLAEGAEGITMQTKWCQPRQLTIEPAVPLA